MWRQKVSIPLPAAAALLLVLAGLTVYGVLSEDVSSPAFYRVASAVQYVQIERFEPASAVRVQQEPGGKLLEWEEQ